MTIEGFQPARRARRRFIYLSMGSVLASSLAIPALAQTPPPVFQSIDENGVDLATGQLYLAVASVGIGPGGPGSLRYNWVNDPAAQTEALGYIVEDTSVYTIKTFSVVVGANTETFKVNGTPGIAPFTQEQGRGSTLNYNISTAIYTYTSADGAVATFGKQPTTGHNPSSYPQILTLTYPAGEKLTYYYRDDGSSPNAVYGLKSVTSSLGYQLRVTGTFVGTGHQYLVTQVVAFNMANETCDPTASACTLTGTWPSLSYDSSNGRITDATGKWVSLTGSGTYPNWTTVVAYPSGRTRTYTRAGGRIASMTDGRGTWTYEYPNPVGVATIVKEPGDTVGRQISFWTSGRVSGDTVLPGGGAAVVTYGYDSNWRLKNIYQDGLETRYEYDTRGNVTETRMISRTPGTPADIVTSAGYPATCTNQKVCNQPDYTIDARGNRTDYTYDTNHGGVLTTTSPAATSGGVRPQTRNNYTALQANFRDGTGTVVQGPATYRLTGISQCQSGASCAGTSDEVKTNLAYGSNDALLPISVSSGAGDGSLTATTMTTYMPTGDIKAVDGPLAGSDDTSRTYYDAARRATGEIGPDPDGGGSLLRRATRTNYDQDGNPSSIERGTATSQTDTAMTSFSALEQVVTDYDAQGRVVSKRVVAGGTTFEVQQTSYTDAGRIDCVATRMNPAIFGALPSSACALGTPGDFGPDRITHYQYDALGRQSVVQTAYGVSGAQTNEISTTYTATSRRQTTIDGENNTTSYEYDGFDRLSKTFYPVTTKGAGSSSTTDFEQLTYDAAGNVLFRRLRDSTAISLNYDNLNRLITKDLPSPDGDTYYSYDLLGRLTGGNLNGLTVGFTYDALGRQLSQTVPLGTFSFAYDLAGRRTRLTWPDAFYVAYDYDLTNKMTAIRENGAVSGIGVLGGFGYDNLGRRTSLTRGNGTITTYGYDAASRLTALNQNIAGSTQDLTLAFDYNPAGQIVSSTRSNDAFSWSEPASVNRSYASNGLNQLTASGTTVLQYNDLRGNLTQSGSNSYSYNSENLIRTGPGANVTYDPLNRITKTIGTTTTRFAYENEDLIAEYDGTGALTRRYVHGPEADEPLVWYQGSGTTDRRWLHADERGSIIAVTDSAGSTAGGGINRYSEFGIPASSNVGRFQYTGQAWIPELGMYYYKARIYSATLGRFMQTDPMGYDDDPNWYNYVGSDPINRTDPTGLCDNGVNLVWHHDVYDGNTGQFNPDKSFSMPLGQMCFDNAGQNYMQNTQSYTITPGATGIHMPALTRPDPRKRNQYICNLLAKHYYNVRRAWEDANADRGKYSGGKSNWSNPDYLYMRSAENFLWAATEWIPKLLIWGHAWSKSARRAFGYKTTPYSFDAEMSGYEGADLYGSTREQLAEWCDANGK